MSLNKRKRNATCWGLWAQVTSHDVCFWVLELYLCSDWVWHKDSCLRIRVILLGGWQSWELPCSACFQVEWWIAVGALGRVWLYCTWAEYPVEPREFGCAACLQSESHLTMLTWTWTCPLGAETQTLTLPCFCLPSLYSVDMTQGSDINLKQCFLIFLVLHYIIVLQSFTR